MALGLCLSACALALILSYWAQVEKCAKVLIVAFSLWWSVILVWSFVDPYGGYNVSERTYLLLALFILSFGVGFSLLKPRSETSPKAINLDELCVQYDIFLAQNNVMLVVSLVICAILGYYAFRYGSIMTLDTFQNARTERFYVGSLFGSTFELLFYNYVISAFRYLFSFVISFSLVFDRWRQPIFWVSAIGLVLYSYIGSSRFPFVLLIIVLLMLSLLRTAYSNRSAVGEIIKTTALFVLAIALVMVAMSYLTAFRRGSFIFGLESVSENLIILWDQIIGYNIGPISGLSLLLDSGAMYNHAYCGFVAVFNGMGELLSSFLGYLDIPFSPKYELAAIANVEQAVGSEQFNALYTCVYWFYSDSGIVGVVVFSVLFGWAVRCASRLFESQPSLLAMMILLHCSYFMIASNMIWQIGNVDSLLYMGFLYLFSKTVRSKRMSD